MAIELVMAMEMATAITMVTATARTTMTKGELPLYVPAMCSSVAGATPCLYPHGHKGNCIHQCCIIGVTLLRAKSVCSLSRGRIPDSSPWILVLFIICNYCSAY